MKGTCNLGTMNRPLIKEREGKHSISVGITWSASSQRQRKLFGKQLPTTSVAAEQKGTKWKLHQPNWERKPWKARPIVNRTKLKQGVLT